MYAMSDHSTSAPSTNLDWYQEDWFLNLVGEY